MRQTLLSIIVVALIACFCRCSMQPADDGYGQEYPLDPERYAIIDSCMAYMDSDPTLAHHMLDSVRRLGIISPQRCDYLHAMVLSGSQNQNDSALMICNRLLDEGRFGDDRFIEAEICVLATNITSDLGRNAELLRYAHRGINLCHGVERLRSDEAMLMGRAGASFQILGQYDEASETYAHALEIISQDPSFGGLNARISLLKKQASLYHEMADYDRVITIYHEILSLVERFDRDPSMADPRPQTMSESSQATHEFAGFYQSQAYIRLANAYRMLVEQGLSSNPQAARDSAYAYMEQWRQLDGSHLSNGYIAKALPELYFTGHMDEFDAIKTIAGQSFGSDTLLVEYVDYLKLMARVSASRHDIHQSNGYLQRALAVSDSIRRQEMLRTFAEQASIHMVQEAQLVQKDAEYQLAHHRMYIILLVAALLTLGLIHLLVWLHRRHKKIVESVQHDLQESKQEIMDLEQQLEVAKAERSQNNVKELYEHIEQVMTEKKLYLNPEFDIKLLASEVGSGLTTVSVCINSVTGKSFRLWLAEYRLSLFVQMLNEQPDKSSEELMLLCGYKEQSTLRRNFKAFYGMTVSEYRKRVIEQQHKQST